VLERLAPFLPPSSRQSAGWTGRTVLPGGAGTASETAAVLARNYPFLTPRHANRLAAAYGDLTGSFLAGARAAADLGQWFGATLTEAEVRYLMTREWACIAEDVLWRRTKLGLAFSDSEAAALDRFMESVAADAVISPDLLIPPGLPGGISMRGASAANLTLPGRDFP
jgi:glycerol-3-phosphate dehydrogenase